MNISTSPTDYRVSKQLQMLRFNGEYWELFGPIVKNDPAGLGLVRHEADRPCIIRQRNVL